MDDRHMKIIVPKDEFEELAKAFPLLSRSMLYNALAFKSNSVMASVVRCYAVNWVKKAIFLMSPLTNH